MKVCQSDLLHGWFVLHAVQITKYVENWLLRLQGHVLLPPGRLENDTLGRSLPIIQEWCGTIRNCLGSWSAFVLSICVTIHFHLLLVQLFLHYFPHLASLLKLCTVCSFPVQMFVTQSFWLISSMTSASEKIPLFSGRPLLSSRHPI